MAYKRGDRWVGFYRDAAGRQHTNGNFRRKRDADRWEQEKKAAIRNDTWVDPGRSRMTGGEWSETWMAGRVRLKPKTLSSYRSLLTTRVLPTWDKVALTRIRHSEVVPGWRRCAPSCPHPEPGRRTTCCPRCWTTP